MKKVFLNPAIFSLTLALCFSFLTCDLASAKKGDYGSEIQLTAEQKEKAKAIFSKNREAISDTRQLLKEKKEQFKQLMESSNPDRAQAQTLSGEIGDLQGKLLLNRFDLRQQLVKEGLPPQIMNKNKGKKDSKRDFKGKKERRD